MLLGYVKKVETIMEIEKLISNYNVEELLLRGRETNWHKVFKYIFIFDTTKNKWGGKKWDLV